LKEILDCRARSLMLASSEFGGKGEWLENKHDPHDI
jgi:hypothetical protein